MDLINLVVLIDLISVIAWIFVLSGIYAITTISAISTIPVIATITTIATITSPTSTIAITNINELIVTNLKIFEKIYHFYCSNHQYAWAYGLLSYVLVIKRIIFVR